MVDYSVLVAVTGAGAGGVAGAVVDEAAEWLAWSALGEG